MVRHKKKRRIEFLKKENQVKDFMIKELLLIITKNKIKVPEAFMKKINMLYGGDNGTEKESKKKN